MICELTNKFSGYIYWIMAYGDEETNNRDPDIEVEVSAADFVGVLMNTLILSILFVWWWIPSVWIRHNILGRTSDVLHKKRFKCKR